MLFVNIHLIYARVYRYVFFHNNNIHKQKFIVKFIPERDIIILFQRTYANEVN